MGILERLNLAATWWNGATIGMRMFTSKHGTRVGEDDFGNVFYQSHDAKRRWVIYNGEVEASRVGADWHGWLHHTWDELPSDKPLPRKDWEQPHQMNLTGTAEAYAPKGSIRRSEPAARKDYEAWTPE